MATGSNGATNSALGRVLAKRKLKGRLSTIESNERDPAIVIRQVRYLRDSDPDAALIRDRIDEVLSNFDAQVKYELKAGKIAPARAAELLLLIDKSQMSPAELDEITDRHVGAANRVKYSSDVAALEEQIAALKESWGKEKASDRYRDDVKNNNALTDFPDVAEWAPADGTMEDAVRAFEEHYDGTHDNSWWGHPDREKK